MRITPRARPRSGRSAAAACPRWIALRPGCEALEGRQLLALAAVTSPTPLPPAIVTATGPVSADLLNLAHPADSTTVVGLPRPRMIFDAQGRVGIEVTSSDVMTTASALTALGLVATGSDVANHLVEGYFPIDRLSDLTASTVGGLLGVRPIPRPITSAGSVADQADWQMNAERARNAPGGPTGAGVTVGVLSDSYNALGGAAAGVASGDLPANVKVIADGPAGANLTDEGRAMIELIHDLAPGAGAAFATAYNGQVNFGNQIRALADPTNGNAAVITDDVFYTDEPLFQDGVIAQAIAQVVAQRGVSYYTAAGNEDRQSYQSAWRESTGGFFDFDPGAGVDVQQSVTLGGYQTVSLALQWDQPFYTTNGVVTDLNFGLYNPATGQYVAVSSDDNVANQTPFEEIDYANPTGAPLTLDLVVQRVSGPMPGQIKYVNNAAGHSGDLRINEFATNSPTVVPHSAAPGATSVGAATSSDLTVPPGFTSSGPYTALFTAGGVRLASPDVRAVPQVAAVQGTDTTFFGFNYYNDGHPNFFGTSAAAPHAAAVAALLKQAQPNLTPAQVLARFVATAQDIGAPGYDDVSGAGLVDAWGVLNGPVVPATPDFTDRLESGTLGLPYFTHSEGSGRIRVTTANGPASGLEHVTLDSSYGQNYYTTLNMVDLAVNPTGLAAGTPLYLAFKEREYNDADEPMPATFVGSSRTDGVALSVDGVNWYRIVSLTGAASTNAYQPSLYNLTAIAQADGIVLGAGTRIRFQNTTLQMIGSGGAAFDDIAVVTPSRITSTTIDDGTAQRSMVRSLQVLLNGSFSGGLSAVPASAFTVTRTAGGPTQTFAVQVASVAAAGPNQTLVTLTFTGPGLDAGALKSLPDGIYQLQVDGSQLINAYGIALDADGNGSAGGLATVNFHRFFGDANGDMVVDASDYLAFRLAYLSGSATGANSAFDFDGNGVFTVADSNAFLVNMRRRRLV